MILYFLGPKGTYSETAALKIKQIMPEMELCAVSTIAKVVELVNNSNNIAVLPIENSIEGIVRSTIDNIYLSDVKIQMQIDVKVEHCLISKTSDIKNIKHIISHPQALAQCQQFILKNFDEEIDLISAHSTSQAGYFLNDKDENYAAIVSQKLADELKYNILGKNIGDIKENKTRFVLISKKNLHLGKNIRTTIAFNTKNKPGALLKILSIINKHGLNLVYLESRPSKEVFGEYNFFCDIDKGMEEIKTALSEIEQECNFYKLLGSYPVG
ncbi:MAG: prephenate dehydratase [Candidatus Gastranaerophilales bacterium]|nr:prephenate dehydratase [Candidatus Gastranaerophilales bacterium]